MKDTIRIVSFIRMKDTIRIVLDADEGHHHGVLDMKDTIRMVWISNTILMVSFKVLDTDPSWCPGYEGHHQDVWMVSFIR